MYPNNADRMANSEDPDETASSGPVFTLLHVAQTCLSKNLES